MTLQDPTWLETEGERARQLAKKQRQALRIVNEIQKIPHWFFAEISRAFGYILELYIYFGGYSGAASLADPGHPLAL